MSNEEYNIKKSKYESRLKIILDTEKTNIETVEDINVDNTEVQIQSLQPAPTFTQLVTMNGNNPETISGGLVTPSLLLSIIFDTNRINVGLDSSPAIFNIIGDMVVGFGSTACQVFSGGPITFKLNVDTIRATNFTSENDAFGTSNYASLAGNSIGCGIGRAIVGTRTIQYTMSPSTTNANARLRITFNFLNQP